MFTPRIRYSGRQPYGSVVSNYDFDSALGHHLLQNVFKVSAACHCRPGSASPKFFGKNTIQDLTKIEDFTITLEVPIPQVESLGKPRIQVCRLMLPLYVAPSLRCRYPACQGINYTESVSGEDHDKYLWGNSHSHLPPIWPVHMSKTLVRADTRPKQVKS